MKPAKATTSMRTIRNTHDGFFLLGNVCTGGRLETSGGGADEADACGADGIVGTVISDWHFGHLILRPAHAAS
jgi:hypothetical protein